MKKLLTIALVLGTSTNAFSALYDGSWRVKSQSCSVTLGHRPKLCYISRSIVKISSTSNGAIMMDSYNSSGDLVDHLILENKNIKVPQEAGLSYLTLKGDDASWTYIKNTSTLQLLQYMSINRVEDSHYKITITKYIAFKTNKKSFNHSEVLELVSN